MTKVQLQASYIQNSVEPTVDFVMGPVSSNHGNFQCSGFLMQRNNWDKDFLKPSCKFWASEVPVHSISGRVFC